MSILEKPGEVIFVVGIYFWAEVPALGDLGYVIGLLSVDNIKRMNVGAAEAAVVPSPSLQMQISICKSLQ